MQPGPYAAPKSQVRDVLPEPARHWVRTKWLYLFLLALWSFLLFQMRDLLLPALSLLTVGPGLMLAALLSIAPVQAIAARRSGSAPWWWDVLFCCAIGTGLVGTVVDDPALQIIGFLPLVITLSAILLGSWLIEIRYPVRVYSKVRSFVFVDTGASHVKK